ncbi:hemocytin-like [Adelges cooleyi]|uniref:hemocytin-like n=1 Tax=Adelges cooleyi TaxID=133065 RepID=UPI00217F9EAE|nr:hemocytin-like [Adelges cooleyi]
MIKSLLLIAAVAGRLAVTAGDGSPENVKYTDVALDDNTDTVSDFSEFSNDQPPSQSIVFPDYKRFANKTGLNTIKKTKAVCDALCENGGYCEGPNKCKCVGNYTGERCQIKRSSFLKNSGYNVTSENLINKHTEKKIDYSSQTNGGPLENNVALNTDLKHPSPACHGFPNTPKNSKKKCKAGACKISCIEGYQFPDGSSVTNVFCKGGIWSPSNVQWTIVPNCVPICEPPCLNGGNCISPKTCQCPINFRGFQCQYPESSCDVMKLNFNGNYKCSGDEDKNKCTLWCPQGSTLQPFGTAQVEYTCLYETGNFEPKQIPQCVFANQPISMKVITSVVEVTEQYEKRAGSCIRWGYGNFKTFDGAIYSVHSECTFTLVSDVKSNLYHIQARARQGLVEYINIFIGDNLYILKRNDDNSVTLMTNDKPVSIPNELVDIGVEVIGGQTVLTHLRNANINILWKSNGILQLDAGVEVWNSTDGLCGNMDGLPNNDLSHKSVSEFTSKWLVNGFNEICDTPVDEIINVTNSVFVKAETFCSALKKAPFEVCKDKQLTSIDAYIDACKRDYSYCVTKNDLECGCNSIAVYAKDCFGHDQNTMAWRDETLCPFRCPAGKVYSQCLPTVKQTCSMPFDVKPSNNNTYCEEGCICPVGTVEDNGKCISKDECPCKMRNQFYKPGDVINKDCNKCTCTGGEWSCTNAKCQAECYAIGDPHYKTFDGMKFNFMGACSYYLVVLPEFAIEAENIPCDGTMSQEYGYETPAYLGKATCTKTVTIRVGNSTAIKLGQNKLVSVNGEIVDKLPVIVLDVAYIREFSTFFLQVMLTNGIEVLWDGETRLYIHASPELQGKTKGLCGTYNGNQKEDLLTPEGDIETDVVSFANKWKTKESCKNGNLEVALKAPHPCDANIQFKHIAENYCRNITGQQFSDCHTLVDPAAYYEDCLYDMCSCQPGQFSRCYCQILASYALECAHQGLTIDWRKESRECGVQCPAGQHYSPCGNSCQRTCRDISTINACKSNCVEGCYCSPGSALSEFGECIPISECPCYNNGQKYMSEQKRIEGSNKEPRLCTCKSAAWECRAAEQSEVTLWKEVGPNTCNHGKHLEFTECEPSEPITCHNMHDPPQFSPAVCYSGCICKKPYVLDSLSKECVLPSECPCHHGGKSYSNNETYYQGCNTCKCNLGKWKCTKNECNGVCTAWGDSHFQTFDSRYYDFQGACEYVFAKGTLTTYDTFVVSIDVVPCGSTGASCIKSITLTVGNGNEADTVNLKSIVSLPKLKRIQVKEVGIFIVADVPDIGLVIHWDKGTRVHLQLDPKWKSHVNGLCGNYNDNQMDDFQTPFGGMPEVSSLFFGDSWKLQSYCAMPTDIRDACALHPHRRQWAHKQCSVLKSSLFKSCHSHVSVDNYIQRCNFDTCACDQGGDCECLCTAIAAYAQECSLHGVNIKWRSQDMCPIQCENGTAYESCISPCSFKSCDDFLSRTTELCDRKLCVEGCIRPHCPQGQVYLNVSSKICVPINSCKIPCKVEGSDELFNEGDIVFEDKCHTCYCSRNKKICKGQPCVQTFEPEIVLTTPSYVIPVVESQCLSGWSVWIKRSHENNGTNSGFQPLPSIEEILNTKSNGQGMCSPEKVSNIQCRSLNGNNGVKDTTENIECSVDKGISCHGKCNDYEVRVYCECEGEEDNSVLTDNLDIIKRKKNTTRIVCPVGLKCKIMCNQICQSFENEIKTTSVCESPQHCISGCVETIEQNDICPEGSMWRDKDTCVHKSDCTCYSRNGTQVKPGGIYKEDSCTVCQCLNNAYVCDDSSCKIHEIFSNEKTEFTTTSSYETTNNQELSTPNLIVSELPLLFTETTPSSTEFTSKTNIIETSSQLPTEFTSQSTANTQDYFSQNLETSTHHNIVYVPSTVSEPALHCDINQVESISSKLEPSSFNASSWYSSNTEPYYAQLDSEDNGYWRPAKSSETEYLQMDLGQAETIYGIEVTGSPTHDEYVTSYLVAHSLDGVGFSFVSYNGQPKIFRGPHAHNKVEKQILVSPIEARYIRVLPKSWHNEIAIKLALLGCPIKSTTFNHEFSTTLEPTLKPVCSEPMGIESGLLNDAMISVSSSLNNDFHSDNLSLNSTTSWIPFTASTNQWIQVDFTGPRIITGIVTKGNPLGNEVGEAWVEAYKVIYSNDLVNWNKILDSNEKEKIFSGNFDSSSTLKMFLDTPIRARYIRIHPEKWHNKPALRLEILGCFEAYSVTQTVLFEVTEKPVVSTSNCSICPGIVDYECKCSPEKWWNGESCGLRSECPCVIGVMTYQIGTVYDLENCQQCMCTIGGVPNCAPKVCSPCPPGEVSTTLSSSCRCECEPCKNGTKLCPTSNVCLDESLWCNGVQDCADDERNCPVTSTTTPPPPPTTTTANIISTISETEEVKYVVPIIPIKTKKYHFCPEIKCPEGQIAKILNTLPLKSSRKVRSAEIVSDDPWPSPFSPVTNLAASLKRNHRDPIFSTKGNTIRRKGAATNVNFKSGAVKSENQEPICKQWVCEARVQQVQCKTPLIACPEGYFLQITPNEHDICPVYTCVSSGLEESQCDIDGRVFKTFDGTVFKYEVCDHIISRDRVHNKWKIKQIRRCPYVGACQQSLWLEHLNHTIEFFPNMTTTFDGYHYTVNQLQAIGSQTEQFAVKQVQTNYIIFASTLGFNIIWQVNGNVKIKLNAFYTGRVDGLCGFFDNNPKNDKLKRDGDIASTTSEFGHSWADSNLQCEAKICPVHVQKEAIKACDAFRSEPLNQCEHFVNIDEYVMKCVESICSCLENSASEMSECRCKAISGLVTQCYTTNSSVELSDWRLLHDCPVNCQSPFVFKECFNRACEPSCDNLLQNDPCPKLPENCFPGCYCPDGYIKEYGNCIKPSKCRNCVCEGSGTSHYTTFDKVDYVHRQNCSHVLVKTTKENDSVKPGFTIVETTGKCSSPLLNNGICLQNLTITHAAHKLSLSYNADASKILTTVDGHEVNSTPFANKWMSLTESPGKSIIANIPVLELEVIFMFMNQGFSIKMPSHLYYDKTEGLCGSCNGDSTDDMAAPDGNIPSNVDEFIKSWKASGTEFEKCDYVTKNETKEDTCEIPKPEIDPCLILTDTKLFGQCHPIVDVQVHIKKCHSMLCEGSEGSFCHSLEAYVRECQSFGICLDWRSPNLCPYSCPPGLMYKACMSGCEETCDNYKALRSGETTCNGLSTEMCVCPPGQVFNNSVCVNENRCEPCDNENHYAGDTWLVDQCTTCTCTPSSKAIRCEKKQCQQSSFSICQTGFKSVKDETKSDECCEQYKCIPEENRVQNCTDIIMPVCAEDQIVKMELTPNGCKRFICECIPRDECLQSTPDNDVELLPGMVNVINNQGCCPSFKASCVPETCPEPKPCDLYYEQIKIENHQCCPQYKCELPNNTCIYEYEWIASNEGGERKRNNNEKAVILKQLIDTWEDGPCRSCFCDVDSKKGMCNKLECSPSPSNSEYVMAAKMKYGQCCPTYKRESCIHQGTVYNVGSEWTSADPCKTLSCKLDSNDEAYVHESVKSCNSDCALGWAYVKPNMPNNCCGSCVQDSCVMQNKAYAENDTWTYDNCTTYLCEKSAFNEFNILPVYQSCPNIGNCPENRIYKDGCCERCNATGTEEVASDKSLCAPESLPLNHTVGLVIEESLFHDTCTNPDGIVGFTECRGLCDSYTYFNKKTTKHDSKCQCCQPIRYEEVSVSLQCKDGYRYKKSVAVPSACSCTACGGDSFSLKISKKH